MENESFKNYRGMRVLITGGLGFIGSSIAHRLVDLGAKVTLLDALLPQNGGRMENISGVQNKVEVVIDDIRNNEVIKRLVVDKDVIFNLAGQVSYVDSMNDPFLDLDISCLGHLTLLDCCRMLNQKVRIVFASSRLVYRRGVACPVAEDAPVEPLTMYGIHKLTGEHYHRLYSEVYNISTAAIRIPNPYGPRQRIQGGKYGIVNWFLSLAMKGETLKVFGKGNQGRDYIYIDDLVEIFLRVALLPKLDGQIYNAGSGNMTAFNTMVEDIIQSAGSGSIEYVPWPENYASFETGDFVANVNKLVRDTGYRPRTSLIDGLKLTVQFYRNENKKP